MTHQGHALVPSANHFETPIVSEPMHDRANQARKPGLAAGNAKNVAEVVLYLLAKQQGTAIWIEPIEHETRHDVHRLTIEENRSQIVSSLLDDGLGHAVLARLALLAGLDLLVQTVQNGRLAARVGDATLDLLVTIRPTSGGLAGEVRVLNNLGQELNTNLAAQPDGDAYPETLPPGAMVGPYRVEKTLGRGGMGTVYLVEHTHLRKSFAMKVLHKSMLAMDADVAGRFVREARAAARVQHDGIIDVSDFGSFADGRHYLVMQLLAGQSLYEMIAMRGAMEPVRALGLMRNVASALAAAHAAGVVHCDMSPSNIFVNLVDGHERIKIVDFGAASVVDADLEDVPDGPPGMIMGTPHYMAPEQVQGLPMDSRSDMYSFGAVLYELISGRVPFDGSSAGEIVIKHLRDPVPPLFSDENEEVPESVWLLIERLMAKKPENRYQSTDALVADIDRVMVLLQRKGWRRWLPV